MSKKWITFLVAAVIGALLLPAGAFAACRINTMTTLAITDATTPTFVGDPVPLPSGDKVTKLAPNGTATELLIDAEGVFERSNDILVTDDGVAPACFAVVPPNASGNTLQFTINAAMTSPVAGAGVPSAPANLDVYDSNGINGLSVVASSSTGIGGGNTQQTIITVTVTRAGTAGDLVVGGAGAAFRLKNLRFDATTINGTDLTFSTTIAALNAAVINDSTFGPGKLGAVAKLMTANNGTVAALDPFGNGCPVGSSGTAIGGGLQNSGSGLNLCAAQLPNVQEGANGTFRIAGGACNTTQAAAGTWAIAASADTCVSGVANDVATVATSVAFAQTGIPSGVTTTFPSTISTQGNAGAATQTSAGVLTLGATTRGGSPLAFTGATGSSSQTVVYDTIFSGTAGAGNGFNLETADVADPGTVVGNATIGTLNPNCVVSGSSVISNNANGAGCDANPKEGVQVANPSGNGRVTIFAAVGRGTVAGFTGDDVAAAGVFPAYTGSGRRIIRNSGRSWFTVTPVRTTMLFPYVVTSTAGGFNTGLAISNTCTDTGVFLTGSGKPTTTPTCNNAAGITFYFDGVNQATGAAYTASLATDLTAGGVAIPAASCPLGNLDANGRLKPGTTFACGASQLLSLISGAPASFTGHVFAVMLAQGGHGFAVTFAAGGTPAGSSNAVVLESNTGTRGGIAGDGVNGN